MINKKCLFFVFGLILFTDSISLSLSPLDCTIEPTSPKCRTRTGPTQLADKQKYLDMLNELLSKFSNGNGETEMNSLKGHIEDMFGKVSFIRQLMQSRQREIEEIVQNLLPLAQRSSVVNSNSAFDIRQKIIATTEQMFRISQSLPDSTYVEDQKRFENIIISIQKIRNSIDPKGKAKASEALSETSLLQHFPVQEVQLIQQTLQQDNPNSGVSLVQTVLYLLDEVIYSMKDSKKKLQDQSVSTINKWSEAIDRTQVIIEQLTSELQVYQKGATQNLAHAIRLKLYLKKITAEQYYALQWYETLKNSLIEFGRNFDSSLRMRADIHKVFEKLVFYVQEGDIPYQASPIIGCDGNGAVEDSCGVCRGSNLTCLDCNGYPNGDARMDVCSVCADGLGHDCRYFCDSVPNSGKVEDLCGICNGNEKACVGCDNLPHSLVNFDTCGVCGGDGSSCQKQKGCGGVECSGSISCPIGKSIVDTGYQGCCFDPKFDCVNATITLL